MVKVDVSRTLASTMRIERRVRFATALALTRTAKRIETAEKDEMRRVFDRPTPFALGGTYTRPATRDRLEAEVGLREFAGKGTPAVKFLQAQVFGGIRGQKRSERALRLKGFLGNKGFWVPGAGAKLNAYGNIPGPTMVRILADIRAFGEQGYVANRTARSTTRNARYRRERYFVAKPGSHLAPGVWVRRGPSGRDVMPVLVFVGAVHYRRRLDFYGVGLRVAPGAFREELAAALDHAFRTAR